MDVRVLRYFLAVAREESFSRAAKSLYLSQPSISRQIQELEEELGAPLFVRGSRNVTLTREGMRLRRRAQEIVDLVDKTREEFADLEDEISGDVYIGGGETHLMREIARIAIAVREEYPGVRYHLHSGNADDVIERLDKGLLDFGLLIGPAPVQKYEFLQLPGCDVWGLLMRVEHPLAQKETVEAADLAGVPLLISRQSAACGRSFPAAGPESGGFEHRRHLQPGVQRRHHGGTGHGLRADAG